MLDHLSFGIRLHVPTSQVWRLITDTRTWPMWGPSVREVDLAERFIRSGSTGRIRLPMGIWVPFTVERCEPESYWDWKVGGVAATGHRIESRGVDRCDLYFTVPVWAAPYGIICKVALARIKKLLILGR